MNARARVRSLATAGSLLAVWATAGCATYSDRLVAAHAAVEVGDYGQGIRELDRVLDVESAEQVPEDFGSDTALAVLERGTLLQSVGRWELSARDMQTADSQLDFLDLTQDTLGSIGKYVYSDSAEVYKAPPSERLALNAFNMLNYLARSDLEGSRVEARRYTVVRDYLNELDPELARSSLGSYLSGFVFEQLGNAEEAVRYYDEALGFRDQPSLAAPLRDLAGRTSYRGRNVEAFLERHPGEALARTKDTGDLLVVAAVGRVPYKEPRRIPVGAAVGLAGTFITGDTAVLEHSVLKVVVYPELVPANSLFDKAAVRASETPLELHLAEDYGALVTAEYQEMLPAIMGAAVSRLIVRAAAAEAARVAGNQADGAIGLLAALAVEGAMVAADKPDTRSWTFLPDRVFVGRSRVPAGDHTVEVALSGRVDEKRSIPVSVPAGGFAAVVLTAPR